MSNSWAKHKMRENRNNQYRPEQIEFYKKIRKERPDNPVLMEHEIHYINEQGKWMTAIGDIVDLKTKEYWRLNGTIHNSRVKKDWEQKEYLAGLGWKVIDVDV